MDFTLYSVISNRKIMLKEGQLIVKGSFEK